MAQLRRVHVTRTFSSPPEVVFRELASPEGLERVFGAKIRRLVEGRNFVDGEGSVRELKAGPMTIQETVLVAEEPTHIEYTITKGGPLRDHRGIQHFTPTADGGTTLEYTMQFRSPIPGFARLFQASTERTLAKGLPRLAP